MPASNVDLCGGIEICTSREEGADVASADAVGEPPGQRKPPDAKASGKT